MTSSQIGHLLGLLHLLWLLGSSEMKFSFCSFHYLPSYDGEEPAGYKKTNGNNDYAKAIVCLLWYC